VQPNRSILLASTLLALLLGACQPPQSLTLTGAGMDMFAPVKMRLHPLSRIQNSTIEARIEFTDQFGDVGKGVGAAAFELFTYNSILPSHEGTSLATWHMNILTPAENRLHWDSITRTYLFTLPLEGDNATHAGKYTLVARVTLANGQKLTDSLTLTSK
jgi:hypothetical protein